MIQRAQVIAQIACCFAQAPSESAQPSFLKAGFICVNEHLERSDWEKQQVS